MEKRRHTIRMCALFAIPYVSLFLMYISSMCETSNLIIEGYGQLVFWMTNILSLLYGVLIVIWLVLLYNLPKHLKRGICILEMICFIFCIAMLYRTLFNMQLFMFILNGRNFLFEWLGIYLICLLLTFMKVGIKKEVL